MWKRYPAYKDSGVEWLGAVPERWAVLRLKNVTHFGYGNSLAADDRVPGEYYVYGSNGIVGRHEQPNTKGPCLIIGRKGSFGKVVYSEKSCFVIDTTYFVDSTLTDNNLRWLYYCLQWLQLDSFTKDSAVPGLSREDAYENRVLFCSVDEQRAIAAFLDRETGCIDTLVAKKERQIEILQEKRAALISHAVTKGLDPDAPMKDSGVEWLGAVPEHWAFLPLKRNWQVTDCKHKTVSFIDEGVPVASIGEVQDIDVDLCNAKMTTSEEYRELIDGGRKPKRGDIIYSRNATVGAAAFVNTDIDFCMGQDVCLISSKTNSQRFLVYQLRSPVVMNQLESLVVGATFKRINVAQIKNFLVACPSQKEQDAIAIHCDKVAHRNDIFITKVRESISKLREYRTALISAAVTGKIDVIEELVS